jgi:hypothetical protein
MSKPRWSWREFRGELQGIHAAAAFYHKLSDDKQLEELAKDIEERQMIFDPIHIATVKGKLYLIDGISRLDAIEATGREIVNEKGEWKGMLLGKVVNHGIKTDEEVWDIVHSLNDQRRHLTTSQRAMIAAKRVQMREQVASEKDLRANLPKSLRPGHRPSKGVATATQEEAKKVKVRPRSVKSARRVRTEAPEKVPDIMAGKKSVGKAESELSFMPQPQRDKPTKRTPEEIFAWFGDRVRAYFHVTSDSGVIPAKIVVIKALLDDKELGGEPVLKYPNCEERSLRQRLAGKRKGGEDHLS